MVEIALKEGDCVIITSKIDGKDIEFKVSNWGGSKAYGLYVMAYDKDDRNRNATIWEIERDMRE